MKGEKTMKFKEIRVRIYDERVGENDVLEEWLCKRLNFTKREHDFIISDLYFDMVYVCSCKPDCIIADVYIDGKKLHKYEVVSIFADFISFYVDGKFLCCKGVHQ